MVPEVGRLYMEGRRPHLLPGDPLRCHDILLGEICVEKVG